MLAFSSRSLAVGRSAGIEPRLSHLSDRHLGSHQGSDLELCMALNYRFSFAFQHSTNHHPSSYFIGAQLGYPHFLLWTIA